MDEEVHGFVWHALPPLNTRVRSDDPFIPNGSDPSAHDPSFVEKKHHHKHHKKDVAERGMDEEVHGFVWHAIPPLNTRVRSDDPFVPNGSDPSAHDPSFAEHKHKKHHKHHKKDVAERGMDEEVHGFVSEITNPINVRLRSDTPFIPNGSAIGDWDENAFAQKQSMAQAEKKDIIHPAGWTNARVYPYVSSQLPPLS
jgi:putative component of membrane protein insertase Oxa1/YidC/SpoIIIJ protein YidD